MGIKELSFKNEIQRLSGAQRNLVLLGLMVLLIVSVGCLYEDYRTTVAGLELVPGQVVNGWLRPLLGLAPTALQIVFMFVAVTQRNRIAGLIALLAWVFDFGTDMAYRMEGVDPTIGNIAMVTFMCFMVASFFSEFMLMFTLPHISYAIGPALGGWWAGIREAVREAKAAATDGMMNDAQRMMYPTTETSEFDYEQGTVRKQARKGWNS